MSSEAAEGTDLPTEVHRNPHHRVVRAVSAAAALLAALLIAVGAYYVLSGGDRDRILALGYPGVAIFMFFSSATVLLPAPGLLSVLAASGIAQLNPWVLGLSAGLGSSLGELTGYLVGLGSREALSHGATSGRWLHHCEYFMRRWGFLTILVMAAVPNPAFDAVGIVAGSLGYPWRRMWLACFIGNTIKCTYIALFGASAAGFFGGFFSS